MLTPTSSMALPFAVVPKRNLTEFHGTPLDSSHAAAGVVSTWNFMRTYLLVNVHGIAGSFEVSHQTVTENTTVALGMAADNVTLRRLHHRLKLEKC